MKLTNSRLRLARSANSAAIAIFACLAAGFSESAAQENQISPPAALQFPFEAKPEAPRGRSIAFFRAIVEQKADLALCEILMKRDGKPMPEGDFEDEHCLPEYRQRVASNTGDIHWASGARPITCSDCVGRPFMSAQDFRNRPNLRRAMLYGRLKFTAEVPGPNRNVIYPFNAYFTCSAENGQREGELLVDIEFSPPVLSDPGAVESILSFFTVGEFSRYLEARIEKELSPVPDVQSPEGRCLSVGLDMGSAAINDNVRFDPPPQASGPRVASAATAAALRDTATIRLLRITRNPLPPLVAPEHAHPGDPMAGQFTIFANGVQNFLPPQGLLLPPEGGAVAINFCKTIEMTDADRLQLIFTNDLGGAVWSQFPSSGNFGAGGVRTMTTGRSIVVPGRPGPPDPRTGRPRPAKPQTVYLREFELLYDITFNPSPGTVGATTGRATSGGATTGGATTGGATSGGKTSGGKTTRLSKSAVAGALGKKPEAAIDPSQPAPQPCVQL